MGAAGPIMMGVGALMQGGGSIYGSYMANETAKDNYKMQLMQYNDWLKKEEETEAYNKQQNQLANTLAYGNYANKLKTDTQSTYGKYNTSIGR